MNSIGQKEALLAASKMKKDPEIHCLLGQLHEKKGHWATAFDYYVSAFKTEPNRSENALPLYQLGKALNRWREMKTIFEESLRSHLEASPVRQYLVDIDEYLEMGAG